MANDDVKAARGSALVLEEVRKLFGTAIAVDEVSLAVAPSEFVTLLGPSGSGKTTVLRMIGGFIAPSAGRILIDGHDVVKVPVERRPTAMLFQQLSLWPHLSVARNVSFGLELRKRPKREIADRVAELLSIVGLADFGDRLPAQLSGGQQQRVALARALALEPRILLLDEPFSALDTKLRIELRTFVRSLQREVGTTTILVTHDQEEALELSDRIVVLRDGRIEQVGSPSAVYDAPETGFVAEFLGAMNFFAGSIAGSLVHLEGGVAVPVLLPPEARSGRLEVGVRPEDVLVEAGGADFAVERITPKGYFNELSLRYGPLSMRAYVAKDLPLEAGGSCGVRFRRVHLFPQGDHLPLADGVSAVAPPIDSPAEAIAEMTAPGQAGR